MSAPCIVISPSTYPALDAEVEFLQIQIEHAIWLQDELDVTLAKLDNISRPGVGSGGALSPHERSVCNFHAMIASRCLHEALSHWAVEVRTLGVLSSPASNSIAGIAAWLIAVEGPKRLATKPELFRHAYNAVVEAVADAKRVVDLPAVDDYSTSPWTRIPVQYKMRGGETVDPLDAIDAPAVLTYALAGYGVHVTTMQIANWGKNGKLERHHVDGMRQYRLGDVVDVWLEREEKRARMAANRAAAEERKAAQTELLECGGAQSLSVGVL